MERFAFGKLLDLFKTAFQGYRSEKYKINTSFVSPEGLKARFNKTGIKFVIFILILVEDFL